MVGWRDRGELRSVAVVFTLAALAAAGLDGAEPARAATTNITLDLSGANGVGSMSTAAVSCADGGTGSSWHTDYQALTGVHSWTADAHLDVHSDGAGSPQTAYSGAFMPDGGSRLSLANDRGTIELGLSSIQNSCAKAALGFDGKTVNGDGSWSVISADGAYRSAGGAGSFSILDAGVAPGAVNPFHMTLSGSLSVLDPSLSVTVARAFWGQLGLDYVLRVLSVTYQITNAGPGDAFAPVLTAASSPTPGVTLIGPVPQSLDDLASGASTLVTVRYQLGVTAPCQAVILNCKFSTVVGVTMPDALDIPHAFSAPLPVTGPDLPPPL